MPTMSPLAKKYLSLQNIYDELQKQNEAIFAQEHKRSELEIELSECNGTFKARKRGGLQNQIYELNKQIDNMKRYLSSIVQRHGYDNVRDFYSTYYAAKGEYADYVKDVEEWNVNHVKKNENIPTEENRTDRYQIGEEWNFIISKDKEDTIRTEYR
jgi:mobA/mobL family